MNNFENRESSMIEALEIIGGSLWEKYDKKRVYFNSNKLISIVNLTYRTYRSGAMPNEFYLKGTGISNNKGRSYLSELKGAKVYYDFADNEFHCIGSSTFSEEIIEGLKSELDWYFKTNGEIKADELDDFKELLKKDVYVVLNGDEIDMEKYSDIVSSYNERYNLSIRCHFLDDVVNYIFDIAKTIQKEHLLDDTEEYERSLALDIGEVEFISNLMDGLVDGICDYGVMTPLKENVLELRGVNSAISSLYNLLGHLIYATGSVAQYMRNIEALDIQAEEEKAETVERDVN